MQGIVVICSNLNCWIRVVKHKCRLECNKDLILSYRIRNLIAITCYSIAIPVIEQSLRHIPTSTYLV